MKHQQARKRKHQRAVDQIAKGFDALTQAILQQGPVSFEAEIKALKAIGYRIMDKAVSQRAVGV